MKLVSAHTMQGIDKRAIEEFGIPGRASSIPGDPAGIREPHDVLAAEEFAMPAGAEPHGDPRSPASAGQGAGGGGPGVRAFLPLALAALVLVIVLRRRR